MASGLAWSATASGWECSGTPAAVGFDSKVALQFCGQKLCQLHVIAGTTPTSSVRERFDKWRGKLDEKYGTPTRSEIQVPDECAQDFVGCIKTGRAVAKVEWRWHGGRSILLMVRFGGCGREGNRLVRDAGRKRRRPVRACAANPETNEAGTIPPGPDRLSTVAAQNPKPSSLFLFSKRPAVRAAFQELQIEFGQRRFAAGEVRASRARTYIVSRTRARRSEGVALTRDAIHSPVAVPECAKARATKREIRSFRAGTYVAF